MVKVQSVISKIIVGEDVCLRILFRFHYKPIAKTTYVIRQANTVIFESVFYLIPSSGVRSIDIIDKRKKKIADKKVSAPMVEREAAASELKKVS